MLRDLARAAALRAARSLLLPELAAALDGREVRTWADLMDLLALLGEVDRRLLTLEPALAEARDDAQRQRALADAALAELRSEQAARHVAERGVALLIAQRDAAQKRADEAEARVKALQAQLASSAALAGVASPTRPR